MQNKNSKSFLFSLLFFSTSFCFAQTNDMPHHPFYIGAIAGFGSTTWQGLVPSEENQNVALMLSTPIDVEEGGSAWGVLAGYEFTRFFAIENQLYAFSRCEYSFRLHKFIQFQTRWFRGFNNPN
ncbi:hypothetical protein [Legionella cherrii]|uniref:hypothetical protein n=1 Tax=Legionella cherrii TaxID=28084 RepID=UPI001F546ED3|nr:hypothetical protein [Legionella cherrii]